MEIRKFRIYGRDGHRQRLSFEASRLYDFSSEETGTRIIEFFNSDRTGHVAEINEAGKEINSIYF